MTSLLPSQNSNLFNPAIALKKPTSQQALLFGNTSDSAETIDAKLAGLKPETKFLFLSAKKIAKDLGQSEVNFSHVVLSFMQMANHSLNAYINQVDLEALVGPQEQFIKPIANLLLPDVIVNTDHAKRLQNVLNVYSDILLNDIILPENKSSVATERIDFSEAIKSVVTVMSESPDFQSPERLIQTFAKMKTVDVKAMDKQSADAIELFNEFLEELAKPELTQASPKTSDAKVDVAKLRAQQMNRGLSLTNPFVASALNASFNVAGLADANEAGIEHVVSYLLRVTEFMLNNPKLLATSPDEMDLPTRAGLAVFNAILPNQLQNQSVSNKALLNIVKKAKQDLDKLVYANGLNPEGEPVRSLNEDAHEIFSTFSFYFKEQGNIGDLVEYLKDVKAHNGSMLSDETLLAIGILEGLETAVSEAKNNPTVDIADEPETVEDFETLLEERKAYYEQTDAGKKNYKTIKGYIDELASLNPQESAKHLQRLKTIFRMPTEKTEDNLDLHHAKEILDSKLYALDEVKEDVLEAIAAIKTQKENGVEGSATVIALLGPPGIGKTAISKLIAEAMGRQFAEIHLGGVSDANALTGHNFTYQGSQQGMLSKALADSGSVNPVVLMDEVGRLTDGGLQGDPSGPLINITDPTKDYSTKDDYMGISFSYKDAVIVMTANDISRLPAALKDRIKIIDLNGYGDTEKAEIGKRFLLSESLEELGYDKSHIELMPDALTSLVEDYTYEPGVRKLKEKIKAIVYKLNYREQMGQTVNRQVTAADLKDLLGEPDLRITRVLDEPAIGYVNGLATMGDVKGSMFPLTVTKSTFTQSDSTAPPVLRWATGTPGRTHGDMTHDSLANVLSFVKSDRFRNNLSELGFEFEQGKVIDVAFQVASSTSMDGPSAGAAITTALISELTGRPIRNDVAMTGTIINNLGGVGAVGGIPLKVPAARKSGAKVTFIPKECERDYDKDFSDAMKVQMPKITYEEFKAQGFPEAEAGKMWVIPVDKIENVLEYSLLPQAQAQSSLPGGVKQTPEITPVSKKQRLLNRVLRRSAQPAFGGGYNVSETALGSRLNQVS